MVGTDAYTRLIAKVKQMGVSIDVTHYVLSLGAANATTGQYAKSFAAGTTIEMPIFSRAAQQFLTDIGIYVRSETTGFTTSSISEGDEIKDAANNYYRIDWIKNHYIGNTLIYREVALTFLPLHGV